MDKSKRFPSESEYGYRSDEDGCIFLLKALGFIHRRLGLNRHLSQHSTIQCIAKFLVFIGSKVEESGLHIIWDMIGNQEYFDGVLEKHSSDYRMAQYWMKPLTDRAKEMDTDGNIAGYLGSYEVLIGESERISEYFSKENFPGLTCFELVRLILRHPLRGDDEEILSHIKDLKPLIAQDPDSGLTPLYHEVPEDDPLQYLHDSETVTDLITKVN